MRYRLMVCAVVLLALLPASASSQQPLQVTESRELAPGVVHQRVAAPGPNRVNVARVAPGSGRLRAVLSNDQVAEPAVGARLERTSAACERVGGIVCINGDFFFTPTNGSPELLQLPLGGLVAGGQMLRSPNASHHQASLTREGRLAVGQLNWSGSVVTATRLDRQPVSAVNWPRQADQLVVYTPAFGPRTLTNPHGHEVVVRLTQPTGPLMLAQTHIAEMVEFRPASGDTPIPPDGLVLSGHGAAATFLERAWQNGDRNLLLRLDTTPDVVESVGGTPVLVHECRAWVDGANRERHPRTLIGETANGELIAVTVDGRQPGTSRGMTLLESAELMLQLGACEAINLDGGGSTTMAVGRTVLNRPSDTQVRRGGNEEIVSSPRPGDRIVGPVERPTVSVLAVVPNSEQRQLVIVSPGDIPGNRAAGTPSSVPYSASPVVLASASPRGEGPPGRAAALATLLVLSTGCATAYQIRAHKRRWRSYFA